MSKKKLTGIILGCITVIIVVVMITRQPAPTPTYTLSVSVSPSGAGSVSSSGGQYQSGVQVTVSASPASGARFVRWTGDTDTIANVYAAAATITMTGDYSVTAYFVEYTPMVAAGGDHTVGLKLDGTVVAVGDNYSEQCNVGNWTDIVQVAADGDHTVGVKSDGTVVAVGDNYYGQCDVGGWTNIV